MESDERHACTRARAPSPGHILHAQVSAAAHLQRLLILRSEHLLVQQQQLVRRSMLHDDSLRSGAVRWPLCPEQQPPSVKLMEAVPSWMAKPPRANEGGRSMRKKACAPIASGPAR